MPVPLGRLAVRFVALFALVVLAGALVGAPAVAQHRHDGPGFYDPGCPLAALAAVDRQTSAVAATDSTPLVAAAAFVALPSVGRPAHARAADVRFRAPPVR